MSFPKVPPYIRPEQSCVTSTNPLRAAEPGVVFGPPTNAWGKDDNAQKVWLHIGVSLDRCEVLAACLQACDGGSDFAKRTIASYLALEYHALFTMLTHTRKRHVRVERSHELKRLDGVIGRMLKDTDRFERLRNKLVAHLDGDLDVTTMVDLWQLLTRSNLEHWRDLVRDYLRELAPHFSHDYAGLAMSNTAAPEIHMPAQPDDSYVPFDS